MPNWWDDPPAPELPWTKTDVASLRLLYRFSPMNIDLIAEILERSPGSVKSKIQQLRRKDQRNGVLFFGYRVVRGRKISLGRLRA